MEFVRGKNLPVHDHDDCLGSDSPPHPNPRPRGEREKRGVSDAYGASSLPRGEISCGGHAAGKSTTMKFSVAILPLTPALCLEGRGRKIFSLPRGGANKLRRL